MQTVLIIVHIILAVLIIGTVLMQRSSSDGLEGLSGGGSHDSIFSGRSTATFLSKTTTILITLFMINCIVLANLSLRESKNNILSKIQTQNNIVDEKASVPIAE
jgi:preprotein translocase subunit SecG